MKKIFTKIKEFKNKHTILFFMILFIICYLPYIIVFYPGTMNVDVLVEIQEYWGLSKWDTQHPIFPTIMYGNFMTLGRTLLNENFGLFLINIVQLLLAVLLLSYSINYIYKITNSKKLMYFLFGFFAFLPIWPIHFYTGVKDIWFSMAFLWYIIFTIKFVKAEGKLTKIEWFSYFCSIIFTYLFRNNGVHVIILSLPFIALAVKKIEKVKIISVTLLAVVICFTFTKVCMHTMNIEKGNIKEVLAIPFQQTSHYIHNYELTDEEFNAIDKLIKVETFKERYDPECIDSLKNSHYNSGVTNEDVKRYLKVWVKMVLKHPITAVKATLNSTYGYFYPNRGPYKNGIAQFTIDSTGRFAGFNISNLDLHYTNLPNAEGARNIIYSVTHVLRHVPLIGLFFGIGIYTWILFALTLVLIYFKKYRELAVLVPIYVSLLVCIASPVNAYTRYSLPIMITIPFVTALVIDKRNRLAKK